MGYLASNSLGLNNKQMSGTSYFKKITSTDDITSIAEDIVKLKTQFICKSQDKTDVFSLQSLKYVIKQKNEFRIICKKTKEHTLPKKLPTQILASFSIDRQKYFLLTTLSEEPEEKFQIVLSEKLYLLQRRQSYRIEIPEHIKSQIEIRYDSKNKTHGHVIDISSTGLRAKFPSKITKSLQMGSVVEIAFKISSKAQIKLKSEIKHIKPDPIYSDLVIVGLHHVNLTQQVESQLFSLTLDLHRMLFNKLE